MTVYVTDDWNKIDILKELKKFKESANQSMRFDYSGANNSSIFETISITCSLEGFKRQEVGFMYIKIFKTNSSQSNPSSSTVSCKDSAVDTPEEKNARSEALTAFMSEIERSAEWFSTTRAVTLDNVRAIYLDLMKKVQGIY